MDAADEDVHTDKPPVAAPSACLRTLVLPPSIDHKPSDLNLDRLHTSPSVSTWPLLEGYPGCRILIIATSLRTVLQCPTRDPPRGLSNEQTIDVPNKLYNR